METNQLFEIVEKNNFQKFYDVTLSHNNFKYVSEIEN